MAGLLNFLRFWSLARQGGPVIPPDTGAGTGDLIFSKATSSAWYVVIF
jgi:hypothetical protein